MSEVNGVIQAVLDRVQNACEHDLERWQKIYDQRKAEGQDTTNPNCYSCEYQELREKLSRRKRRIQ